MGYVGNKGKSNALHRPLIYYKLLLLNHMTFCKDLYVSVHLVHRVQRYHILLRGTICCCLYGIGTINFANLDI